MTQKVTVLKNIDSLLLSSEQPVSPSSAEISHSELHRASTALGWNTTQIQLFILILTLILIFSCHICSSPILSGTLSWGHVNKRLLIYRSRNDLKTTEHQKPTPAWVTADKSWNPGAHCPTCRWFNKLESVSFMQLQSSEQLPGLCLFQVAQLV